MGVMISKLERDGETRRFAAHGSATLGSAGGLTLLRGTYEPGWRWSKDVAPIAGTETCQIHHLGYAMSGRMQLHFADGSETVIETGDLFDIPPDHDAWVLGDEPFVMVDTSPDATRYARGGAATPADDKYMTLVRRGYAAFNSGDVDTLRQIMSHDVVQHVPGDSQIAGAYKGIDAVLGLYKKLGELTGGQIRADLVNVFGDGKGHVTSQHQVTATRNGVTRVSRGSILFTFLGDRATDLLEMYEDLPGEDAFYA